MTDDLDVMQPPQLVDDTQIERLWPERSGVLGIALKQVGNVPRRVGRPESSCSPAGLNASWFLPSGLLIEIVMPIANPMIDDRT